MCTGSFSKVEETNKDEFGALSMLKASLSTFVSSITLPFKRVLHASHFHVDSGCFLASQKDIRHWKSYLQSLTSRNVRFSGAPRTVASMTNMPSEVPTSDLEELHDYFKTHGLIDIPCLLQSYQDQDQAQLQVNDLMEKNQLLTLAMPSGSGNKKSTLTKVQHKYIMQFAKHCMSTIDPWVDESKIFQTQESIDNSRSTFISRIKNDCFRIVFGSMVPSASEQGFDMFKDLTCQQLLGYDTEKKVYTSLPPILWPDGMRGTDNHYLFRNETLMKILTVTLFGSASLKEAKANKKKPTNGILWGMNEVTPGAIAFVAIMAHFVLSGNKHFDKCGTRSHIQYAADFKLYKSTIIKYLNKHHMKDTIAAFNQFVFEDRGLDHNNQRAEDDEIIEIPNDFSDSSGSDKEPFEVQGVNTQSNSELAPTSGPSNVTVEELISNVGAVTLSESNAMNNVEHTTQVTDKIDTGHGRGNKRWGQGKVRGAALVSQHQAPVPTCQSNCTTHRTDEDEGIEEDDIYG
ncbi:hypothetical protein EDD18DRAFT_1114372 [Armillaria luteobubalina]|uniref:Uncharacterized protein n=1 Tax=Armillaria luteobubalina TaxID=153913 RepID=A0AA39P5N5_9AGAR|nr:hypothetical protein EDD18DRAFT_1114372 [Armillaria luteobubalina]